MITIMRVYKGISYTDPQLALYFFALLPFGKDWLSKYPYIKHAVAKLTKEEKKMRHCTYDGETTTHPYQRSSYKRLVCTKAASIRYDTCWNARKENKDLIGSCSKKKNLPKQAKGTGYGPGPHLDKVVGVYFVC